MQGLNPEAKMTLLRGMVSYAQKLRRTKRRCSNLLLFSTVYYTQLPKYTLMLTWMLALRLL